MKPKSVPASAKDSKDTLYCSFCGLSQHEVKYLIAGPTVFICDECVDLCDDIFLERENENDILVRIKFKSDEISGLLESSFIEAIDKLLPESRISYKLARTVDSDSLKVIVSATNADDEPLTSEEKREVTKTIKELSEKVSNYTQMFLSESKKREALQNEINELKAEYLDFLRAHHVIPNDDSSFKAVMFLDLVGFSSLLESEREAVLTLLRGIAKPLIEEKGASELNTWGDAIVCTFQNHEKAIEICWKFLRHLSVEQFEGRVGLAWGEVTTSFNAAIQRLDISGSTVNLAARLEPLAEAGEILCSSNFIALEYTNHNIDISKKTISLKKGFDNYKKGDEFEVCSATMAKN